MNDCSDNFSPPHPDRCLRLHSFWLWNMTTDYLACLAMKLLCFVFSSRGGEGSAEEPGEGGVVCLLGAQGHDCVKGIEGK